MLVGEFY